MKAVIGSARVTGRVAALWMAGLASLGFTASGALAAPPAGPGAEATAVAAPTLDGRDVYQVLLGEIALARGEADVAAQAYADAAQRTGDEALFGRAVQVAVEARQYEVALDMSRRWVAAFPDSASARHALVGILAGTGRGNEMMPHLERLLALDEPGRPRNILHLPRLLSGANTVVAVDAVRVLLAPYKDLPESLYVQASFERSAGQIEPALASVREATRMRPDWIPATFLEAQLQATAPDAIAVWSRFLSKNKDSEQAYLQRARLYVGEKQYAEARADFEAALALNPASVDTLYALGILALQTNDRAAAEKYFQRLDGHQFGGKALVDYQLGVLAQERGDLDGAKKHFAAVDKGDYYVVARANLALIAAKQGQPDEARRILAETELVTPSDRARLAIAESQLLREAKQYEAAFAVLEKALVAQPNEPDLLYDSAMLAERLKKNDVLDSNLTRLIELRPENAHAYNALGYSWAERNIRLDEARQLIVKALELAPRDPFILDSMGWVMFRLGEPKAALVHLEEAYRQRKDPEIAAHLGEVLWSIGRRDEARKILLEARKQHPDNDVLGAAIGRFLP